MCNTRFDDKFPQVDQVNPDNYTANVLLGHGKQTSQEPTKVVLYPTLSQSYALVGSILLTH